MVAAVALVLLVSEDHSAKAVGGLLLAESLPGLLSAWAGAIADRMDRRRLMIVAQIGQGVIFAGIALWLPPYVALIGLVVVSSLLGTLVRAAAQSAVPALVDKDELLTANALLGTAFNMSFTLGPMLGGALAGLAGPHVALGVDALTFFASAASLLLLPALPPVQDKDSTDSRGAAVALRYAWGHPVLRGVLLSLTLLVAFAGVDNVALVYLVRETLDGGSFAYGVASAVFGVGMIAGTALIVRRSGWSAEMLMFGSIVATIVGTLGLGLASVLAIVYVAQVAGGIGNGIDVAAGNTLLQRHAPPAMIGRVMGLSQVGVSAGFLVAYIGGGALVDATSPRTAFLIAAAGTTLALVALIPVVRPKPST